MHKLRRLLRSSDIAHALDLSMKSIQKHLTEAYTNYFSIKHQANQWRTDFLDDLAQSRFDELRTFVETELKKLKHHERQRKMARNIKRVRNKLNQTAINQVCVTENGNRRLVTGKRDIENACIAENEARFSQFENTPPMTASLLTELGYLAETSAADSILDGT